MTITLNLAPEDEAQLNGIAARQGRNADKVAYSLFTAALAQAAGERGETATDQYGLGESLAGRTRPVAVWDAEFRAKYSIPSDLEPLSEEELNALP